MGLFRRRPDHDDPELPEPPFAEAPGALPPELADLPPGRPFRTEEDDAEVGWVSEEPVDAGLWTKLAARFPETGLWPLLVEPYGDDPEQPFEYLALEGDRGRVAQTSAESVLAELWGVLDDEPDPEHLESLAPFGAEFPGLAQVRPEPRPGGVAAAARSAGSARLALVPVTRGADAPAAIGWTGPVNHVDEVWKLSAVLRSWEERFGALLVGLGFDTMTVAVRRPPTGEDAVAVAAEHYSFCSDNVDQGSGSIRAYARDIDGRGAWQFWWD
jgi:hypothetical protein